MPALRMILVRMFPNILGGTTQNNSKNFAKYGSSFGGSRGFGGNSAVKSGFGKNQNSSKDPHAITYTKSFAVQHGETDEVSLVQLDEFGPKGAKARSNNSTSDVSL
jgi:hypothetical protein